MTPKIKVKKDKKIPPGIYNATLDKVKVTKSGEICITLKDITPFKQRKQKS